MGFIVVLASLGVLFYSVFLKSAPPISQSQSKVVSPLSEELDRLEIKWNFLDDKRLQSLENGPDISSLTIEESGRENPFQPF